MSLARKRLWVAGMTLALLAAALPFSAIAAPGNGASYLVGLRDTGGAQKLRAAGFTTSMSPRAEKPGKLRKAAEDRGARYAIWLEAGQFSVWQRDGDTTERGLDTAGLVKWLGERAR